MANLAGGMAGWAMVYDAVTVELDAVRVVQVRRRGKGCLSYLVGAGDQAFVVDPSSIRRCTADWPTNTGGGSPACSTPTSTPIT